MKIKVINHIITVIYRLYQYLKISFHFLVSLNTRVYNMFFLHLILYI